MGQIADLPIDAFSAVAINTRSLKPWHSRRVHRLGFERSFFGPRILVPRGVSTSQMRLRAAYLDEPVTFRSIIQAIVAPKEESERAKFIAAVLNSRLAVWYAFHGTSSFGSSRPEVQQSDLLRLPMPEPEDVPFPEDARLARRKLVELVDSYSANHAEVLRSQDDEARMLQAIDALTYSYFGLSEEEVTLIEDAVEHILPAAQPNAGSFPDLWKSTSSIERAAYANQLTKSLDGWLIDGHSISTQLVSSNNDFGILGLKLCREADIGSEVYVENNDASFSEALGSISSALNRPLAQNFQTVPDLRIFVGDILYLIKPMQRRFWLKSSALADADSIASDIQTLLSTDRIRSVAS